MTEAQQRGTSKPGDPFAHVWNNGENHIEWPCFMARNIHHLLWVMIIARQKVQSCSSEFWHNNRI